MTLVNFEASRFVVAGQAVVSLRDLNACDAQDLVFNLTTGINVSRIVPWNTTSHTTMTPVTVYDLIFLSAHILYYYYVSIF